VFGRVRRSVRRAIRRPYSVFSKLSLIVFGEEQSFSSVIIRFPGP